MRLRRELYRLKLKLGLLTLALPLLAGGCVVASAVTAVVVLPVKLVGAGIDAAVTTQSESDEKRGRAARKADERAAREAKKAPRAS